jgi:hypothetical protein
VAFAASETIAAVENNCYITALINQKLRCYSLVHNFYQQRFDSSPRRELLLKSRVYDII